MELSMPVRQSISILLWMSLPVVASFTAWRVWLRRRPGAEERAAKIGRGLSRAAIGGTVTILMVVVFWAADLPDRKTAALPLVGIFAHAFGALLGWLGSRVARVTHPQRAACVMGCSQSNVLTFGGITTVLLLGTAADPGAEAALQRMALYRLFESPFYFVFLWPVCSVIATGGRGGAGWGTVFRNAFQPVTLLPMGGMAVGFGLNLAGLQRPVVFDGVAAYLVKLNVVMMGLTVGLSLRHARPVKNLGFGLAIALVKFLLVPAGTVAVGWLLGYRGLSLQVALICASMPVAFMAVLGSALLRLDVELIGSVWLFTTLGVFVVVPWLAVAVPWVGGL